MAYKKIKENFLKRNYKIAWYMNFIFISCLLLLIININYELNRRSIEYLHSGDEYFEVLSFNTEKSIKPIKNFTLIIDFNNRPSKYHLIELFDEDMNLILETNDSILNYSPNYYERGYIKITKIGKFAENDAEEKRYSWILYEIDPNKDDDYKFHFNYNPAIWEEEPYIKWK